MVTMNAGSPAKAAVAKWNKATVVFEINVTSPPLLTACGRQQKSDPHIVRPLPLGNHFQFATQPLLHEGIISLNWCLSLSG